MKRLSILLVLLVCATTNVVAQYQYTHGVDAATTEITFDVIKIGDVFLMLDNVENVKGDQAIVWTDGTRLTEKEYSRIAIGDIDVSGFYRAIRETFSEEEYKVLENGKDRMEVLFVVSPEGSILECSWFINLTARTKNITPDQFALFEQNIKKYVTYSVTEDMKKLQFFRAIHNLNFGMLGVKYRNMNLDLVLPDSLQINP